MLNIQRKFSEANLPLKVFTDVEKSGLRVRDDSIFQMSIRHEKGIETFIMYMGKDNNVRILDVDNRFRQVILELHEPEREYTRQVYNRSTKKMEDKIETTTSERRKYLIGHDEISLFMCELPSLASTTVKEAHQELKPQRVKRLTRADVKRQGEWFFIPANKNEKKAIKERKAETSTKIEGSGGKPHIAQEIIKVYDTVVTNYKYGGTRTTKTLINQFVRGTMSHPDHFPLRLKGWHRVYRNTEVQRRQTNVTGTRTTIINGWID